MDCSSSSCCDQDSNNERMDYKPRDNFKYLLHQKKYRILRKLCSNDQDPITMEELPKSGRGVFFTSGRDGKVYGFLPSALSNYIQTSGKLENPFTREPFSDSVIRRLDKTSGEMDPKIFLLREKINRDTRLEKEMQSIVTYLTDEILSIFNEIEEWIKLSRYMKKDRHMDIIHTIYVPKIFNGTMEVMNAISEEIDKEKHWMALEQSLRNKMKSIFMYINLHGEVDEHDRNIVTYLMYVISIMKNISAVMAKKSCPSTLDKDQLSVYSTTIKSMSRALACDLKSFRLSTILVLTIPAKEKEDLLKDLMGTDHKEASDDDDSDSDFDDFIYSVPSSTRRRIQILDSESESESESDDDDMVTNGTTPKEDDVMHISE